MSKYKQINLTKIKRYSILRRKSKVKITNFAKSGKKKILFNNFISNLPNILAAQKLKQVINDIVLAHKHKKQVILMIGGHIIKCGLGPVIIDLMKRKVITAIAMNGAASIHDFEIALAGTTSEEVTTALADGSFGMAEETGKLINEAINHSISDNTGMGESIGKKIIILKAPYKNLSILATAYLLNIPATVHVAIGTDIIHQHPETNGAAIGNSSFIDFKIFTNEVSKLENGVILNCGSAVIMPEVFLKALSISRNLGYKVYKFTTVNFDMIQHYRPITNVITRPTLKGGKGYAITGHHEIMIPLLAQAIIEKL
ncbi:MAG: hypothetical protein AABY84_09815 [Candidatus Firestonebacteria bacterium]